MYIIVVSIVYILFFCNHIVGKHLQYTHMQCKSIHYYIKERFYNLIISYLHWNWCDWFNNCNWSGAFIILLITKWSTATESVNTHQYYKNGQSLLRLEYLKSNHHVFMKTVDFIIRFICLQLLSLCCRNEPQQSLLYPQINVVLVHASVSSYHTLVPMM